MNNFIQIENRKGKLSLNDGVHKESADKLIEELNRLYGPAAVAAQMRIGDVVCAADDALESVEITINSPGGSVFEGQRIYSALREMSARGVEINTVVNGLAASMGSVILMAGDKRSMTRESRIMIHEASSIAWGDAKTMKRTADLLEGISRDIANIYAERTGGDPAALRDLMLAETWMDADKAQELGFVHSVVSYGKDKDEKAKAETSQDFDIRTTEPKTTHMSLLAKLFPNNEGLEQIEAQLAEIESLRNDLTAAQSRIEELAPLAEANAALQSELSEVQAKLAEADKLANENAQTIADLQAKAEAVEETAASKATEILATIGQPEPLPIDGTQNSAPKSILDQFNELKGTEATTFYKKHRKAILAEQEKLSNQ